MLEENQILQKLDELTELVTAQKLLWKEVLNFTEAAQYLDLSHSYLYQMVSKEVIPCYKPNGKKLYFNRLELDEWLLSNKQRSSREIEKMADELFTEKRRA